MALSQRFQGMTLFKLKWLLIAAAIVLLFTSKRLKRLQPWAQSHFVSLSLGLNGSFFILALLAKISQLASLRMSGQDFWLFQDLLEQMRQGGWMLTRFAPQAIGMVQHGAVHLFFSWATLIPFAWVFGSTTATLLWGPLVFAGAGAFLAALVRQRAGGLNALLINAAFLFSSLVARVLMFEVHPESAYPLFTFAWAWAAGWSDNRVRPTPLIAATLLLTGIKEDSFLVLFPLLAVSLHASARPRRWLGVSALLSIAMTGFFFYAIRNYSNGSWGPHTWQNMPVVLPVGAGLMHYHHWDGPGSAIIILSEVFAEKGGLLAVIGGFFTYLISRPLLSLWILAPWILLQSTFWLTALPLLAVFSLLQDPGKLLNYYSAPLLGIFWLAASQIGPFQPKNKASPFNSSLWLLIGCFLLGGSSLEFFRPTHQQEQTKKDILSLAHCLPKPSQGPRGMVSSQFLNLIPRNQVRADHIGSEALETFDFFLFSTDLPSYEFPLSAAEVLLERLKKDPQWMRLDPQCKLHPLTTPNTGLTHYAIVKTNVGGAYSE